MALKAVLASKSDVDALPETQRSLYKESDGGRFVLDVEGMVDEDTYASLNSRLAEFRTRNIQLLKDAERFKDVDPDEYRRVKADLATLQQQQPGPKKSDDAATIAAAIEKATKPLSDKLAAIEAERDAARKQLETKELHDELWRVGVTAGVRDEARDFWLLEAAKLFRRTDDGSLVGFKGDQPLPSQRKNRSHDPLTAEEWALEIAPKTPALALLYKGSGGAGAQQQQSQNGQRIISAGNQDAISSNIEAIASGKVLIQQ